MQPVGFKRLKQLVYIYMKCWLRWLEEPDGVCVSCTGDGEQGGRWVDKVIMG
jgi:hypothetical protein